MKLKRTFEKDILPNPPPKKKEKKRKLFAAGKPIRTRTMT